MTMRNDIAVLITRAEARGVVLRVREGQVEARGLECLPQQLADELRVHKADVLRHLFNQENWAASEGTTRLLAWAAELAEHDLELSSPVTYEECSTQTVTTGRASWYAAHYLTIIFNARLQQETESCGRMTPGLVARARRGGHRCAGEVEGSTRSTRGRTARQARQARLR